MRRTSRVTIYAEVDSASAGRQLDRGTIIGISILSEITVTRDNAHSGEVLVKLEEVASGAEDGAEQGRMSRCQWLRAM